MTRLEGICEVVESFYPAGSVYGRHHHEASSLFVVLSGRVDDRVASSSGLECARGSSGFVPAGVEHSSSFGFGPVHSLNIVFDQDWLDRSGISGPALGAARYCADASKSVLAHRLLAIEPMRGACRGVAAEELVLELVLRTAAPGARETERRAPCWIARVVEALHASEPLRLADLAACAGRDPAHVCRTFRAAFGCSISEYMRLLRVERAAVSLRESDLPLAIVALRCGFSDQAHFTRAFKACFGTTPRDYRAGRARSFDPPAGLGR